MKLEQEKSYMLAVPTNSEDILDLEGIIGRLYDATDFTLKDIQNKQGNMEITVEYKNHIYDACFYPTTYELPELYRSLHLFEDLDLEKLQNAKEGITVEMEFSKDVLDSYHLQLKLIGTILTDVAGILDDSSEKLLSGKWAKLAAESSVPPAPRYLFTTQAVYCEQSDTVWLHTHGLNRCGLTEVEVLNSTKDNYNNHYGVVETVANRLMGSEDPIIPKEPMFVGRLTEEDYLVCTLIPWEEAVEHYDPQLLGGKMDRTEGHNLNTSVVFVYCCEEDYNNGKYNELCVYDDILGENPIFYLTNEETERMSQLAKERIFFAIHALQEKENKVLIKIGLTVDEEFQEDENSREHIWFELTQFEGNMLTGKLTQEPYYVSKMHVGDVAQFTVEQITDWLIYTPEQRISPDDVYLLI